MIVRMWMSREPAVVAVETSVADAAAVMTSRHVRRLPVVAHGAGKPRLLGIVTTSDLYRAYPADINPFGIAAPELGPHHITVGDVMTHRPRTTTPDSPIEEAAAVLRDHKIGALPVVHGEELVGLITESDVFRAFIELLETAPGDVRITFDASSRQEDTFASVVKLAEKRRVRIVGVINSHHDGHAQCVVRVAGAEVDQFLDDLWKSGHPVLNILRRH